MRQSGDPTIAARVRAARAFAGLDQPALAKAIGVGPGTYKRMEQGTRPISPAERTAIARCCGVPLVFIEDGFDALLVVSDDLLARRVLGEIRDLRKDIASQQHRTRRAQDALAAARITLDRALIDTDGQPSDEQSSSARR